MKIKMTRLAVACVLPPLGACLSYTPLGKVTPARGADVVATVAPLEARVGEVTVHGVTRVEGRVAFADADSLVVAGTRFISQTGAEYRSIGDLVTIASAQVAEIRQRRLSPWKTAVALGAGGAAVAAIIAGVESLGGFGSGSGGGKPAPP